VILIDYSRISIAGVIASFGKSGDKIELGLARHFILNTIRASKVKLQQEFGKDVVIACDARRYWRRDVYPYYKANRKKGREESSIDWDGLFEANNQVKQELKEYFPYRVLEVDGCEADDVIGSLCHQFGNTSEKIVLVADDKDFFQLQAYMNVFQYDPIKRKKMITCPNPGLYLKEHIMRGDSGDGIPNFLSDDDTFVVDGKRSKPVREASLREWVKTAPETTFDEKQLRGYRRNEQLIDLKQIPNELQINIASEYEAEGGKTRARLMDYFMEKRLRNLLESIGDF
jgi:5'-3' exonuclease